MALLRQPSVHIKQEVPKTFPLFCRVTSPLGEKFLLRRETSSREKESGEDGGKKCEKSVKLTRAAGRLLFPASGHRRCTSYTYLMVSGFTSSSLRRHRLTTQNVGDSGDSGRPVARFMAFQIHSARFPTNASRLYRTYLIKGMKKSGSGDEWPGEDTFIQIEGGKLR